MLRPVFFDASGWRRKWTRGIGLALLVALLVASGVFATTVVSVPVPSPLPLGFERLTPLPFRTQVSRIKHRVARLLTGYSTVAAPRPGHPLTIAFYTTWADESAPSLSKHIDQIDWVAPTLLSIDAAGRLIETVDAPLRRIVGGNLHHPVVVPVLQNAVEGQWNGSAVAALMHNPTWRRQLIGKLSQTLDRTGDGGIMYDFENLPHGSQADLVRLVAETRAAFMPRHRIVALTVPIDSREWPLRALALAADKLVLMAYDEHWQGGQPGPIASSTWFSNHVATALATIPRGKAVIALGNYGYDWHDGHADSLTVEEAWLSSYESGATPVFDRASGNEGFSFLEEHHRHDVWMQDAATSWNQLHALSRLGVGDVALWRLGSEDPGFWTALSDWRANKPRTRLRTITEQANVDVEGSGELLRVVAQPHPGTRDVRFDSRSSLIVWENYRSLPTPFVVQRTGAKPKLVALTFDDGPDPQWTPKILEILEHYHVPASFFVIGENGVGNSALLEQMLADGDEIGNHSYTHPNMAEEGSAGIGLELNATQRLIEAFTGRSTKLFRAPYFGDAEPTTADELTPALIAQQHGYTVVGLHVDPGDWKRPGAEAIVRATLDSVNSATPDRSANIVLLHDGGGDRSQTVAALPGIITGLEKAGFRIVPISTLAGLDRDAVMPLVKGADLLAVRTDVFAFSVISGVVEALNWIFFFAIALGIIRSVGLTMIALLPGGRRPPATATADPLKVAVIIPAYNEERVIEATIRRILESDYAPLDVIIADDGSADRTSAIVRERFADEARVTLLTLENGGKASALNRALAHTDAEIVVALDADTQFEPTCISRLVQWFENPRIGAVAGNAKVGNRVNLVSRWQAVEYVTAQNIERRALTRFDAIMVVPGAVGAWRRRALEDVGGYPEDTLAEDQDLTLAIQRRGWKVAYDEEAVAWTEAPETFAALAKQRFRWSFGTLQCLWKHRGILRKGRPSGLARIGIPQAWLFQIAFAMISPLIDLALLLSIVGTIVRVVQHGWAQTQTDVLRMAAFWAVFTLIDAGCGLVAYKLDVREKRFPVLLLIGQRFVYRQLMYSVVIRAVAAALGGLGVGWGKLERTGRVGATGSLSAREAKADDQAATVVTGKLEVASV